MNQKMASPLHLDGLSSYGRHCEKSRESEPSPVKLLFERRREHHITTVTTPSLAGCEDLAFG